MSVSLTTRAKRPNELNGDHYWFCDIPSFEKAIKNDELLEWAKVFGNYYGTQRMEITRILGLGARPLLEIDVQGWQQARKLLSSVDAIFIMPPTLEDLWERLANRGTDSLEVRWQRFKAASRELTHTQDYDYLIVNDDINLAVAQVQGIVLGETVDKAHQVAMQSHGEMLRKAFAQSPFVEKIRKEVQNSQNHL
jgi:guanylate kinase